MARGGLAIGGAILGGLIGSLVPGVGTLLGAKVGFLVGGVVGGLAFPQEGPIVEGPRLADLQIQASEAGLPIAVVFGTFRLSGNVIWSAQIRERKVEEKVGGKGGGGGGTQVTFLYSVDLSVAICEGPILGIRKVWADTKLIYDVSDTATFDAQLASSSNLGLEAQGNLGAMTVYVGNETQEPDPLIESDKGTGQVPAYRGIAYVVFDDFQLRNFGNRIPNFSFEVVFSGASITSELGRADIPDSDSTIYTNVNLAFLDANGEAILLASRFSGGGDASYAGPRFKIMRLIGTTLVNVPKVPAIPGSNLDIAAGANAPSRMHMDHPGYTVYTASAGGSVWQAHWDTQTWTRFETTQISFFAQREGDVLCGSNVVLDHFTSGGNFIQATTYSATVVDVGISDNFFWLLEQTGNGTLRRLKKSDLSVDATFTWPISVPLIGILDVHSDTLMFAADQNSSASQIRVWKIEIDGATATITDITGIMNMSKGFEGNEEAWKGFIVQGSLMLYAAGGKSVTAGMVFLISSSLTANAIPLSTVVSNLCTRAGLVTGDLDVSALASDNVSGYAIAREINVRTMLAPLQTAFSFDGFESDGKIKFSKRNNTSVETIAEAELAARKPSSPIPDLITTNRLNEKELPREVNVVYPNSGNDYQQGEQRATRLITKSDLVRSVEVPVAMTDNDARQLADVLLFEAWVSRQDRTIQVSRKYLFLDPSEVITVTTASATFVLRIIDQSFGEPGILQLRCLDQSATVFSSGATGGASDPTKTPPGLVGSTLMALMDIPLLRDADDHPGFYMAARGFTTLWPGAVLFRSLDGGVSFNQMLPIFTETPIGEAVTVLGSGPTTIFDETNTVTVRLSGGVLTSTTEINVLNGSNGCIIGAEVLQFKTATLNGDGDYVLSGLLRARKGTEQHIATHKIGDRFVV